jgi:adenylosuccinate synthase
MNISFRRFEILLPLRFNDGQPVSEDLIVEVELELENRFGSVSAETQLIRGTWRQEGQAYRDHLMRLFIDVADTEENRQFFREYKETLKSRFQQKDIWLTSFPLDVY